MVAKDVSLPQQEPPHYDCLKRELDSPSRELKTPTLTKPPPTLRLFLKALDLSLGVGGL